MSYSVVDPDDCGHADTRPCDLRRLSDAAGMDAVAINRFDATPGERLPLASHSHETRAEAAVVPAADGVSRERPGLERSAPTLLCRIAGVDSE